MLKIALKLIVIKWLRHLKKVKMLDSNIMKGINMVTTQDYYFPILIVWCMKYKSWMFV